MGAAPRMLIDQGRRSPFVVTVDPVHYRLGITTGFPTHLTGILVATNLLQRQEAFPGARVLRIQAQRSQSLRLLIPAVIING
jgi:hypothetical protein